MQTLSQAWKSSDAVSKSYDKVFLFFTTGQVVKCPSFGEIHSGHLESFWEISKILEDSNLFHWKNDKFIETDSRMLVVRGPREEEMGSSYLMGTEFQ